VEVFGNYFAEDEGKHAKVRLTFGYRAGDVSEKEKKDLEEELGYDIAD